MKKITYLEAKQICSGCSEHYIDGYLHGWNGVVKKSKRDKSTRVDNPDWNKIGLDGLNTKIESYNDTNHKFIIDVQRCVNENKTETTQAMKNLLTVVTEQGKEIAELKRQQVSLRDSWFTSMDIVSQRFDNFIGAIHEKIDSWVKTIKELDKNICIVQNNHDAFKLNQDEFRERLEVVEKFNYCQITTNNANSKWQRDHDFVNSHEILKEHIDQLERQVIRSGDTVALGYGAKRIETITKTVG